jgi:hypothetical protein
MAPGQFALWSDLWSLQRAVYTLSQVQLVATFASAEEAKERLWQLPLAEVPVGGSLHIFREGVRPLYDDPHHVTGGHFKMQALTLDVAERCWHELTDAFVGGVFPHGEYVTGVTYMRAHQTRGLKVWLSVANNRPMLSALRMNLRTMLNDEVSNLKFSPHKYVLGPHRTSPPQTQTYVPTAVSSHPAMLAGPVMHVPRAARAMPPSHAYSPNPALVSPNGTPGSPQNDPSHSHGLKPDPDLLDPSDDPIDAILAEYSDRFPLLDASSLQIPDTEWGLLKYEAQMFIELQRELEGSGELPAGPAGAPSPLEEGEPSDT